MKIKSSMQLHPKVPKKLKKKTPKARIALINTLRPELSTLIKDYLSNPSECGGYYQIKECTVLRYIGQEYFECDIVLYDIALAGIFGEFATRVFRKPHPPKEIIFFGEPITKWGDIEKILKPNIRYIQMFADSDINDALGKLSIALQEICFEYKLCK